MSKDWLAFMGAEVMDSRSQEFLMTISMTFLQRLIGNPGEVLCVGCSDGTEMGFFENVKGIDLNEESLEKCRAKKLNVEKMDMHQMTFADKSFDLIYCKDVFEHAIAPIRVIEEFARVSRKYVCIILPDDTWQYNELHLMIPTIKQMLSLAEKAGLLLRSFREYNSLVNACSVGQQFYLFRKHEN